MRAVRNVSRNWPANAALNGTKSTSYFTNKLVNVESPVLCRYRGGAETHTHIHEFQSYGAHITRHWGGQGTYVVSWPSLLMSGT